MNIFDSLGGNSCLWILILMLVLGGCGDGIDRMLSHCSMPILLGILFLLCKDGGIGSIGGCGCNCNG